MPDQDRFQGEGANTIYAPPSKGYNVDPSGGDVDLNVAGKGISTSIWVGVGGDLALTYRDGGDIVYVGVPSGYLLVVRAKVIKQTGTTATDIIVHP